MHVNMSSDANQSIIDKFEGRTLKGRIKMKKESKQERKKERMKERKKERMNKKPPQLVLHVVLCLLIMID